MQTLNYRNLVVACFIIGMLAVVPKEVRAHCDGMDGPVVNAARKALKSGNINHVLYWVRAQDEEAIRAAFKKTLSVRKLNEEAKALADRYFFETLVRIHRAGEGAPYTGLKPAGRDLGPAIQAADKAAANGELRALQQLLVRKITHELEHRFAQVRQERAFDLENTEAGREFVAAYVKFIHYGEGVWQAAKGTGLGHDQEKSANDEELSRGKASHAGHKNDAYESPRREKAIDRLTPPAIKEEHARLHKQMATILKAGGQTGKAAEGVAQALKAHFEKEERVAMPPLGALSDLAKGREPENAAEIARLTKELESDWSEMLEEHEVILRKLKKLKRVAVEEQKEEARRFAEKLMLHAQIEEQVLYPAAILVGKAIRESF